MQHCLICGAASWGPAKSGSLAVSGDFQIELTEAEIADWRRCDSCGALAQARLIEKQADAEFSAFDAVRSVIGAGSTNVDPLQIAVEALKGLMPQPVNRLERLVIAVMRSRPASIINAQTIDDAVNQVLEFARVLDVRMDEPFAVRCDHEVATDE